MRKLSKFATLIAVFTIASCGGGDGFVGEGGGIIDDLFPTPAAITALTSSPSLQSDPGQSVTISAIVRDENNVAIEGVPVVMSSDSGILTVADPLTDASGVMTATLTGGGDPTNRTITVNADAEGIVDTVTVEVVGTDLTISGPAALAQGDTAPYTVLLLDAAGSGIAGETIAIASTNGNSLSSTSLTTDLTGKVTVDVTATVAGSDTISASALGVNAVQALNVSNDNFSLTAPAAGTEIVLNTPATVSLTWTVGGVPQAGQTITFSATRGALTPSSTAVTDANGVASVSISSANAGPAVISASNAAGTSTSVEVEFIATVPASIDVQASPFTIGPGDQSAITAIVRDAANNLVKNQTVVFDLTDITGGQLSSALAITDGQGRARTFYTASSTTSANDGVIIDATVQGTVITGQVALTVAQRELFMSIGTGNEIFEPNTAQYRKEYVVQVTDSQGNGVANVPVQVGILSDNYYKGFWQVSGLFWIRVQTAGPCADEDVNRNGVLDPGEDANNSGRIEAGNIATAVAQNGSGGSFVSDAGGFGVIDVFYPQEFAVWVDVTVTATATVQGTESATSSSFRLPVSGEDVDDITDSPPGNPSPFGTSNTCADTL